VDVLLDGDPRGLEGLEEAVAKIGEALAGQEAVRVSAVTRFGMETLLRRVDQRLAEAADSGALE
ncbi:MAG: hypothetical protein HY680_05985, partial [Chloroflexi bacterium]|nr:hypothetical protein [Chloroflexota bacterium]